MDVDDGCWQIFVQESEVVQLFEGAEDLGSKFLLCGNFFFSVGQNDGGFEAFDDEGKVFIVVVDKREFEVTVVDDGRVVRCAQDAAVEEELKQCLLQSDEYVSYGGIVVSGVCWF